MQQPLQITFKDVSHSDAVAERIREKVAKLDKPFQQITACKVVVEQVQKHQRQGKLHNVSIYVSVPGKELYVSHHPNENLYLAIQEAVDGLRHQLSEYRSRLYRETKDHGQRIHGQIARLFENEDYGFIADEEGNEYYFNLGHLVDVKFHQLHVGNKVRFLPAEGHDGPQARRVSVPKHNNREIH